MLHDSAEHCCTTRVLLSTAVLPSIFSFQKNPKNFLLKREKWFSNDFSGLMFQILSLCLLPSTLTRKNCVCLLTWWIVCYVFVFFSLLINHAVIPWEVSRPSRLLALLWRSLPPSLPAAAWLTSFLHCAEEMNLPVQPAVMYLSPYVCSCVSTLKVPF